jgi:hypothetical protein
MLHKAIAPLFLGLQLAGCMSVPQGLDQSQQKPTVAHRYVVAAHPVKEPVALNTLHAWEVTVTQSDGSPVTQARIDVDGGMPQHGHGLPTQPRVTQNLGGGHYLVEGVKFSMTGWWEIRFKVSTSELGTDAVTFNRVIALQPKGRS